MKHLVIACGILFSLQAYAGNQNPVPPVTTVASVDLKLYLGKWYEIAAIPQVFEKQCTGNTTAEYADVDHGLISVVNTCDTANGKPSVANGRAEVVDPKSDAKLKVTFVDLFGWQFLFAGDYWILGLGDNYSYAVVGAPGRNYAWILSRTPEMTKEQLVEANQVLVAQGFDPCKLISTVQAAGIQKRTPLCQLVSER